MNIREHPVRYGLVPITIGAIIASLLALVVVPIATATSVAGNIAWFVLTPVLLAIALLLWLADFVIFVRLVWRAVG